MIDKRKALETDVLTEQFIPDHVFLYVVTGTIQCYDGSKSYIFKTGDYCIARKNCLARYKAGNDRFEFIMFCFDQAFLKGFQAKHKTVATDFKSTDTFVKIKTTAWIPEFIRSLKPYSDNSGNLNPAFEDIKYEELLIILLQNEPTLAGLFFNFGIPEKINLEDFMNRSFTFNVSIDRFAFLTGRSLSAFKRDFKTVFNEAPNRWLMKKRLQEAYFLIDKKNKKPSDIYLDLGFEGLSHFSFSFKKQFGLTPTELIAQRP